MVEKRYITSSNKNGSKTEQGIISVSGDFGNLTIQQVHDQIKNKEFEYFSRADSVNDVEVIAIMSGTVKCIKTKSNNTAKNNLLNLDDSKN